MRARWRVVRVPLACALSLGLSSVWAERPRRHSSAHFEFRARAERSEAYPFNYARSHLPHLLELWHANRDGELRFQADFRALFLSTGAAVFAETAWTHLDPRFFFGFFADKHYTEDTGSCANERGIATSRFREVGIFNIPAGPPVHCRNSRQFQMIFGDYQGSRARPDGEFLRERRRLCEAHRAREADIRLRHPGETDPFALMRIRLQRGPEYLDCSVQPSPALIPSQQEGYNVFFDLAMRALAPPTRGRPVDPRLIHGVRRGVGLSIAQGSYAFDLSDDAWKRTDPRHMGEQLVLGFAMLDQDAASIPRDYFPASARDGLPLWAQYWRAVQAVFAWSAGSGEIERVRSRAAVQASLDASLAAWRAHGPPLGYVLLHAPSVVAEPGALARADLTEPLGRATPLAPAVSWTQALPSTSARRSAFEASWLDYAQSSPPNLALATPQVPRAWESVQAARVRRPRVLGRDVPPPYLALFRGLCTEYFDRCAAELRRVRHARRRGSTLNDQHRYVRCTAVAPPRSAEARQAHPYYRLLRLAHRVESSRAFLRSIEARETLRVMDALVGSEQELTPPYQAITAAATGGTLRVDDVSLEGVCGCSR